MEKQIITIVGTGMIGCSLAASLSEHWHVVGVDNSAQNLEFALKQGFIHEVQPLEMAVNMADLVVLTTPANITLEIISPVLSASSVNTTVLDFCSTKQAICQNVAQHPYRSRYVAAHPMAGSEKAGPQNAIPNLFEEKRIAICESEKSSNKALLAASNLFRELKMIPMYLTPQQHDSIMAKVSHLPQAAAFCLTNTTDGNEDILAWAGTGFESTTRIARSDAAVWLPILFQNKANVVKGIRRLIENLEATVDALESDNTTAMHAIITKANALQQHIEIIRNHKK